MMRIFYACCVLLLSLTMPLPAQETEPGAADILSMMKTNLNLTQGQLSAVTPIIEKYSSTSDKLRDNLEEDPSDRDNIHRQMEELKDDEAQELSQVLNDDQLTQWKKMARDWNKVSKDDTTNEVAIKPIDQTTPPFERRTAQ